MTRLTPDVRSVIHSLDIGLRFSDDARSKGSTIEELGSLPIYGQVISFINPKNSLRQIAKASNVDEQVITMIAYDLYLRGIVETIEITSRKRRSKAQMPSDTPDAAKLIEKIKSLGITSDQEDETKSDKNTEVEEDFDSMTPEELMSWMETLAARQGATTEGFITESRMDITEVNPNAVQTEDVDAIAWLESLAADTDSEEPDIDDEAIEAQIPDRLQEQGDYEARTEDMPDWLSSTDVDTVNIPDWLMEAVDENPSTDIVAEPEPAVAQHAAPVVDEDPSTDIVAEPISATAIALFTAYVPSEVIAKVRHNLFVYAHTEQYRPDVEQDASKRKDELGGTVPKPKRAKKTAALEIGTSITIIPECNELEFEPESLTKKWHGDWSRFGFEFRPTEDTIDETLFLRISIQVAGIEIAHIKSAIEVVEAEEAESPRKVSASNPLLEHKMRSQTVTPYQRIFISYSRRDSTVAKSYKIAQTALGNDAFLDVDNLRAGEDWRAALARAIDEADIFQLFWSEHSASSEYCRYEWDYALKVRCPHDNCEGFIRPVYWRKPMPSPPTELGRINFRFVPFEDQDD